MARAKLIWITPEAEKIIAYCARVSNPKNQFNEDYSGLLKYCIRHRHWSIFEMVFMCVEITTTRMISAQILRHKSFSFQEFSQRYAKAPAIYIPECRMQDKKNRQNSLECTDDRLAHDFNSEYHDEIIRIEDLYNKWLDKGVAKEVARGILPMSTETKMYMVGSIRSWIHYICVRSDKTTQKEHRDIAESIKKILVEGVPITSGALYNRRKITTMKQLTTLADDNNVEISNDLIENLLELKKEFKNVATD